MSNHYQCNHCGFPLQPCPQCRKVPEPSVIVGRMAKGKPKAYSKAERKRRSVRAKQNRFWELKGQ